MSDTENNITSTCLIDDYDTPPLTHDDLNINIFIESQVKPQKRSFNSIVADCDARGIEIHPLYAEDIVGGYIEISGDEYDEMLRLSGLTRNDIMPDQSQFILSTFKQFMCDDLGCVLKEQVDDQMIKCGLDVGITHDDTNDSERYLQFLKHVFGLLKIKWIRDVTSIANPIVTLKTKTAGGHIYQVEFWATSKAAPDHIYHLGPHFAY